MAKNLTTFVKSLGASSVDTEGLIPYCTWDYVPRTRFNTDRSCVNFNHEQFFCVPQEICCVKFEIWGPGGAPTGGCNCMYQGPAGSGAYAYKYLTVTPGTCYRTHTGWQYCCYPPAGGSNTVKSTPCNVGNRHTWITGTGLTNFCAEQGCSAVSVCCNTAPADGSIQYHFQDSENEGARYFGADGGERGRPGFIQLIDSSLDNTTYYHYRQGIPYPPGLWNKKGGYLIGHLQQSNANNCCIGESSQGILSDFFGTCNPQAGKVNWAGWGMPGVSHCGGGVSCGSHQNPGRIRITFSHCNTFEE
jgi:hypothetical protein